ncbi:hypothetical protein BDV18DRAFT_128647 [Aspergillus unguis]
MASLTPQGLYGGAIKAAIPVGWLDASDLRQIPDHQELFLSRTTLSNLIFEINERVSEETALASLQTSPNSAALGSNPGTTPESIDQAAALYHLNDIRDDDSDVLRIVTLPQQVSLQKLAAARAYKGTVQMSSAPAHSGIPPSIGGAVAGSSADGGLESTVSVHYLLVRLEEQATDILIFFNVPHKEFNEKGDSRGLSSEEELASKVIDGLVEKFEVVDWGLFGG